MTDWKARLGMCAGWLRAYGGARSTEWADAIDHALARIAELEREREQAQTGYVNWRGAVEFDDEAAAFDVGFKKDVCVLILRDARRSPPDEVLCESDSVNLEKAK